MSEPEDVILEGAHQATRFVQGIWRRHSAHAQPELILLADVSSRLEHFVRATFAVPLSVGVAEPPAIPSWFERLGRRIPRHLVERRTIASTDGERLRLPRSLTAIDANGGGLATYRLLSAELACRVQRGTASFLPLDRLERDLFLICEARVVACVLHAELPGLREQMRTARRTERSMRPLAQFLTAQESAVEQELLAALECEPQAEPVESITDTLRWAQERAAQIGALPGSYRGLPAVALWGLLEPTPAERATRSGVALEDEEAHAPWRVTRLKRRPKVRQAIDGEDDDHASLWMIQLDDPQEHVEDPMGLQRPTDRDDKADPADLADSLSELPEARLVAAPGRAREVLASDDPPQIGVTERPRPAGKPGMVYPEWDYRSGTYVEHGAVIRERNAPLGDAAWASAALARRAALRAAVRHRFERLRPRRLRLGRQVDGPEVDLSAYVSVQADLRAGLGSDNRLYEAIKAARRDVAIALLVDVSGSTDSWVTQGLRVVDVEKEALLIVCDALDALSDPYGVFAFSGEGPERVTLLPIKLFEERSSALVHRRIAALEPDRYTRLGTAMRHVTSLLTRQAAAHRLLLVLSDGKPNDVDVYEGRYGIEDSRQAVMEARLQGLHAFCVTVDRHAPAYMPRIFGAGGYAALHHPEHLPTVLVEVLRRLIRR